MAIIEKYLVYILVLLNIVLLVAGQMLWKIGIGKLPKKDIISLALSVFTPYVFSGLVIYGVATIIWFWVISKSGSRLNVIYPLQSLAYILFAFAGMFLYNEKVQPTGWLGMLVITAGVFLVSIK